MLFSNLLIAIALTTLWPIGLLGVLAACAWLERRTLIPEEVVPRRVRRLEAKPAEAADATVPEETAQVVSAYSSVTVGHPPPVGEGSAANGWHPPDPEQVAGAPGQGQRAVPGRAARFAMRRRPGRGRHERR